VKRAILRIFQQAGYVIVKTDTWRELERRLAKSAVAEPATAVANVSAGESARRELSECRSQLAAVESQLAQCQNQLSECASERHSLSLRIGRAETNARSADRERARLQSELAVCRDQLAQVDIAGRIGELETENRRLQQRLADLQTYLKETRGPDHNFYL